MCIKIYIYRVDFQLKSGGKIHGVLWIDLDQMEILIPGISSALTALRLDQHLNEEQCMLMANCVNRFTSCLLKNDEVSQIVKEVQIHRHSHSCTPYGTSCRFSYLKYPSKRTIIAQPLSKSEFDSLEEYNGDINKYTATLDSVKTVLKTLDIVKLDKYTSNDILKLAKVHETDCEKALSVSSVGTTIVMKREVDEIYVNNFNPEWIRAWNRNMNLKVCVDYHAVIT